jgi:hypothetical protein
VHGRSHSLAARRSSGGGYRQNSIPDQRRGGNAGRAPAVGVYRRARAVRKGIGQRITIFGETRERISTTGACRKQRHCSGSAALVAAMQAADRGCLGNPAQDWRVDAPRIRRVLAQAQMGSRPVVASTPSPSGDRVA